MNSFVFHYKFNVSISKMSCRYIRILIFKGNGNDIIMISGYNDINYRIHLTLFTNILPSSYNN